MDRASGGKELLDVGEVAAYLGLEPITIYRYVKSGRLPAIKLGKEWRIRRSALEEFIRQAEQETSLAGRLRNFYTIPDHVIAVAETEELLHRVNVAFFQAGELRGGPLVKFYSGERSGEGTAAQVRRALADAGLAVAQLEAAGRLRFVEEGDPVHGRVEQLRRLHEELADDGGTIWVAFDWTQDVDLDEALRQQGALGAIIRAGRLVVQTGVLEPVMDDWPPASERRLRQSHGAAIWLSKTTLATSRSAPTPPR